MKSIRVIATALFLATITGSVNATKIVDIYVSGGCFKHFSNVEQEYMGILNNQPWWELRCHGCGFNRCEMRYMNGAPGNGGGGTETDQLEEAATNSGIDYVQDQVTSNGSGSETRHYQFTMQDGSILDVYVALTWSPDPEVQGGYKVHAETSSTHS